MIYTKKDAARILRVSVKTIDRAIIDGRLTYHQVGPRIRFAHEDLEHFLGRRIADNTEAPIEPEGRCTIPPHIITELEQELTGISHGNVTLTIHLRDGHPRFVIGRERSFMQEGGG
jgi:excisionase family DNA binding protein